MLRKSRWEITTRGDEIRRDVQGRRSGRHAGAAHRHRGRDRIAVEGTFRGTFTGPLPTPQGEAPPTGNRFALDFVDVFEVRSGQFSAQRVYYDQMALMSQLGLMPEGAAAG